MKRFLSFVLVSGVILFPPCKSLAKVNEKEFLDVASSLIAASTNQSLIASKTKVVEPSTERKLEFHVDPTAEFLNISLLFSKKLKQPEQIVVHPSKGKEIGNFDCGTIMNQYKCHRQIYPDKMDQTEYGQWFFSFTNQGTDPIKVHLKVMGEQVTGRGFKLFADIRPTVQVPLKRPVTAEVGFEGRITYDSIEMESYAEFPSGDTIPLKFLDGGQESDQEKGDGLFTHTFTADDLYPAEIGDLNVKVEVTARDVSRGGVSSESDDDSIGKLNRIVTSESTMQLRDDLITLKKPSGYRLLHWEQTFAGMVVPYSVKRGDTITVRINGKNRTSATIQRGWKWETKGVDLGYGVNEVEVILQGPNWRQTEEYKFNAPKSLLSLIERHINSFVRYFRRN